MLPQALRLFGAWFKSLDFWVTKPGVIHVQRVALTRLAGVRHFAKFKSQWRTPPEGANGDLDFFAALVKGQFATLPNATAAPYWRLLA